MAALSAESAEIAFYIFYVIFYHIIIHFMTIKNFRGVLCSSSPHRALAVRTHEQLGSLMKGFPYWIPI